MATSCLLGSSAVPLVFLEVVPLILLSTQHDSQNQPESLSKPLLTNFGVKEFLCRQTEDAVTRSLVGSAPISRIYIEWNEDTGSQISRMNHIYSGCLIQSTYTPTLQEERQWIAHDGGTPNVPLCYLPSEDPTIFNPHPCYITAFAYRFPFSNNASHSYYSPVLVTENTLVRVLPPKLATLDNPQSSNDTSTPRLSLLVPTWFRQDSFLQDLLGEIGNDFLTESMQKEVLKNHNPETIDELKFKMQTLLSKSIRIGTARNAFRIQSEQEQQLSRIQQSIRAFCESSIDTTTTKSSVQNDSETTTKESRKLDWWPSLLVHSPNHADGKTLLVQAIAKELGCSSIHILRSSILLGKYGSQMDAALETQLHSILISAACKNQSVCIILDQIDMMMPPQFSGRSGAGDASLPVFNAIASYLRNITNSMQRVQEIPFPIKNGLYNPGCGRGTGIILSTKCCLVGIVTCPDDGWRSAQRSEGMGAGGSTILDCMVGDRYRIPLLSAQTRLSAFESAFHREGLILGPSSRSRLPIIAASAAWAKGSAFGSVARHLKQLLSSPTIPEAREAEASLKDLERSFQLVKEDSPKFAQVSFQMNEGDPSLDDETFHQAYFESIGGNTQAKASLEDALALDPTKRRILSWFGLSPPTGVLLYGPPGCGKTLLAKAVANLLKAPGSSREGGTFVSLAVSDIVSAELGTSEKMIKSSLEFADKNAPSVVFLDEFQALFTDRSRGGSGRLTTTLLQCLDDIKTWYEAAGVKGNRVTVIAATNTPWMIDSAFLRPGRFDRVVHVGLPSASDRKSILLLHISRMKLRRKEGSDTRSVLCHHLSNQTKGFSGADLAALCRAAAVRALFEKSEETEVTELHFQEALERDVRPSSDDELVSRLSKWRP